MNASVDFKTNDFDTEKYTWTYTPDAEKATGRLQANITKGRLTVAGVVNEELALFRHVKTILKPERLYANLKNPNILPVTVDTNKTDDSYNLVINNVTRDDCSVLLPKTKIMEQLPQLLARVL